MTTIGLLSFSSSCPNSPFEKSQSKGRRWYCEEFQHCQRLTLNDAPVFGRCVAVDMSLHAHFASQRLEATTSRMTTWNRRLGRSFGMKEPFEFKMLRRAVAAVLPGKSPLMPGQEARGLTKPVAEGERSQARAM